MKVSVSLPEEDVEFLDNYAEAQGISSRSATVHKAVRLLRASELGPDYQGAWREWSQDGEDEAWEIALRDGLR